MERVLILRDEVSLMRCSNQKGPLNYGASIHPDG